jgi:hypothetical protein
MLTRETAGVQKNAGSLIHLGDGVLALNFMPK